MKRISSWLVVGGSWLLLTVPCRAGQVILTLPDDQLRWTLKKAGQWHHCEANGAMTEQACLEYIGDLAIRWGSGFHLSGMSEVGASVEVRYDHP